jgi:hypothetical protein
MSYPRNAASPPRIEIGAVVQISDGAVQTSGVSVAVRVEGGAETAGGGTVSYGSLSGIVYYTPTQAETDYTAFVVVAYKTGCIPASKSIVTSASATAGYSGVDWGKVTAATTTVNLSGTTISTTQQVASVSGRVTANTDQWGGVTVTGMPLPTTSYTAPPSASTNATAVRTELTTELARIDATISSRLAATSYTAPDNATISSISSNLVIVNDNVLSRLSALAYTSPPSAATNATAVRTELAVELARIDAAITSRLPTTSYTAPDNASITAVKAVTDKLNTTLTADGLLWQFTVNALENAPGGGGGGSATLENQELILANLDNVTGAVAAAVARLQLETQITGFPATLCRGSDYDATIESEIRLQLLDLDNEPITEIGGTPVDEITWLFGFGTDRQPRLVEGACSWDDVTNELVIELSADDTEDTPLGAATWQIGAQIGELIRWLGGGTTRVIERQFTA